MYCGAVGFRMYTKFIKIGPVTAAIVFALIIKVANFSDLRIMLDDFCGITRSVKK